MEVIFWKGAVFNVQSKMLLLRLKKKKLEKCLVVVMQNVVTVLKTNEGWK